MTTHKLNLVSKKRILDAESFITILIPIPAWEAVKLDKVTDIDGVEYTRKDYLW